MSITKSTATAVKASTDYDRMVRELVYERKAQATDRLKTEEETAREEKERLIQMEVSYIRAAVVYTTIYCILCGGTMCNRLIE